MRIPKKSFGMSLSIFIIGFGTAKLIMLSMKHWINMPTTKVGFYSACTIK